MGFKPKIPEFELSKARSGTTVVRIFIPTALQTTEILFSDFIDLPNGCSFERGSTKIKHQQQQQQQQEQ
jgi:hypothetical protein